MGRADGATAGESGCIRPSQALSPADAPSAARLCRTKIQSADRLDTGPRIGRLPQCGDWHFNCLVRIGRWWPGTRGATDRLRFPHLSHHQHERLNDQVQARVYLARRIYADAEFARQDTDQGIRLVSDPRAAPAVGLRRQLDHAGRRPQLRLRAEAGRGLSGRRAHERRAGDVRSHDARRQDPACLQQARHHSRRRRRLVRLRAGIFLLQGRPSARLPHRSGYPAPQGPYYTGVGYSNVGDVAREIVEKHLDLCLAAGINHEGINAEVAKGQWEFQIFGKGSKKAADEMWMARYSDAAPDRELRHRHRVSLQAARRYRLERLRHARQLLDHVHARSRRQGVLREADGSLRRPTAPITSRSTVRTTTCA